MFKWLKTKTVQIGGNNQIQDIDTLDSTDLIKSQFIHSLAQLSALTKNDFKTLYGDTVTNFVNYIVLQCRMEKRKVLIDVFSTAILALKKRRGYLLPVGADSETSFREREEWTFAVFSAVLLINIGDNDRLNAVNRILPKQAITWLNRNNKLFELWKDYLNGQNNIFSEIIVKNHFLSSQNDDGSIALLMSEVNPSINTIQKKQPKTEKKIVEHFECDEHDFWQWLEKTIKDKTIAFNQADSVIHRVEIGFLLVIPNIINEFLRYQFSKSELNEKTFNLKQRIVLTKAIKKNGLLVRDVKGSRIHFYCFDKWEERRVISGIIINPQSFFYECLVEIPINPQLSVDPISTN